MAEDIGAVLDGGRLNLPPHPLEYSRSICGADDYRIGRSAEAVDALVEIRRETWEAPTSSLAVPSEIWASGTVSDLVVGSGIRFDDRGEHQLKGVTDYWKLLAVAGRI